MKLGFIGLGKMGKNMVFNLLEKGQEVVATDITVEARAEVEAAGAVNAENVTAMIAVLEAPRTVWIMVPAGEITDSVIRELSEKLEAGDTVINGGNSFFKNSIDHGKLLGEKEIHFMDVGVSGGQDGARNGACLMIGGEQEMFEKNEEIFKSLAAPGAYQFFSGNGAGHYVKMVHNGIEYGMMQAIAEGFDVMRTSAFDINLKDAAHIYNNQSIVTSRLTQWLEEGYDEFGVEIDELSGSAGSGGHQGMIASEAKWAVDTAAEQNVPAANIVSAIDARVSSQENPSYQGKVINLLRRMFGGHKK